MNPPELIDTHAHLDDEQFQGQIDDVLSRARVAGVTRIIAIGTTAESSQECVQLAQRHEHVWAAVGIQPNYCAETTDGDWDQIVALADEDRVVAVGETGLDWYWAYAPLDVQREYFRRHLDLSQATGLPFVVHLREPDQTKHSAEDQPQSCCEDIYRMVREASDRGAIRGVMHSYTGGVEYATAFTELGMHISFAGMVTYKKSTELRTVASSVAADRILVETDAPYLSPEPVRGHRPNEPGLVVHTASCIAHTRGDSLGNFARLTTENALQLFWNGLRTSTSRTDV